PEKMSVPQRMGFALFSDALRCCCGRHRDDGGGENAEIAYTPTDSSWLNRIEARFTALREFTLNGTDHVDHREQGSVIRRYIAWRHRNVGVHRQRWEVSKADVTLGVADARTSFTGSQEFQEKEGPTPHPLYMFPH